MDSLGAVIGRRVAVAVAAVALVVAACTSAGASADDPIRIGVNLWVGYDLLDVAQQEGLFADQGISIEIVDFTSLSDVVAAFERGQIDGMATTVLEVLQVRSETARRPEIVLVTDFSNGADVIVAAPDIDGVADLAGRTVAAEKPLGPFILARALAAVDLALDDVDLVLADQLEIPGLVSADGVAAAVSFPPVSIGLERDHGFRQIFTTADIPGEIVDVVSFGADVLERRPELASAVRAAWDAALDRLSTHPEATIGSMAAREGISAEEMTVLLTEVEHLTWEEQSSRWGDGDLQQACLRAARVLLDLDLVTDLEGSNGCVHRSGSS